MSRSSSFLKRVLPVVLFVRFIDCVRQLGIKPSFDVTQVIRWAVLSFREAEASFPPVLCIPLASGSCLP